MYYNSYCDGYIYYNSYCDGYIYYNKYCGISYNVADSRIRCLYGDVLIYEIIMPT